MNADKNGTQFFSLTDQGGGWHLWRASEPSTFPDFLGPILVKKHDAGFARVRMAPKRQHENMMNIIHGGAMMGFIDVALFCALRVLVGLGNEKSVTVDLSTQFIAPAPAGNILEAQIEIVKEARSLIFQRGTIYTLPAATPEDPIPAERQTPYAHIMRPGDDTATASASFSAIVKKITPRPKPVQKNILGQQP